MIIGLDHIGIALDNIEELGSFLENVLGIPLTGIEKVPERKLKVAFYPIGETDLELLEETGEGSTIAYFLKSRGNGLQHLAFQVDDIDKAVEYMKSKGIEFIEDKPKKGARSRRIIFMKPECTGNILMELSQCE
ncbi:methylmalonyl-CoA epimerase [Lutispora sp.]|uniref:methylmalonyl-CoA epimerase n=1 Tax=Lutispora sp. TaxID=2828727 RepID=UPI000EDFA6AC|nr:methylmalonyl-CoA epimerase [Lutispora sp.]MEA4963699.1 methylmalonyl-CoA epimerase [Lutispora sp.]HCJ56662.1 methylmalonyl-CoA epimerase [Clostridiaceae bacterium]